MRRIPTLLAAAALTAVLAAGCGGAASPPATGKPATPAPTAATPAPPATARPAAAPTPPGPTDVPGGASPTTAGSAGTFDTAWGEAWDALPPGFPVPAGARPADPGDPVDGPVSGAFVVDTPAATAATQVQNGLVAAGYSTEALSGPSEDGALVVDSVGRDPACRVQTTVRPLGGVTMITVLFGAACPWG